MKIFNEYDIWFVTGSQHLYGEETLRQVEEHSKEMAAAFQASSDIPVNIVFKPVVKTPEEITVLCKQASFDDRCIAVMTWMHTFSPSKMWINGLKQLTKPLLHLHTQYNKGIPFGDIDMDFMNLNQSAHGDREHGFIGARMRLKRKIIVGHWTDKALHEKIGKFSRVCAGLAECAKLKIARFGDNMREVAVTEGDKVEAQIVLGFSVNTYGVGGLAKLVDEVEQSKVDALYEEFFKLYTLDPADKESTQYQIRLEIAIKSILEEGGFGAFTTTFEDLYGLKQLPGLACQRLMAAGYGFAGEGDWKTAGMVRVLKTMSRGLTGGTTFMEDYTYHMTADDQLVLGAHMLEICPSIATPKKAEIRVCPLGIGGKEPPARLIFDGKAGRAVCVSLVDMGGRMRLIVNDVDAVEPIAPMPKLPVAGVMWRPLPNLETSATCWIIAGGAHHTVMSYDIKAEELSDLAELLGLEYVHIGENTDPGAIKRDLYFGELAYRLGQ